MPRDSRSTRATTVGLVTAAALGAIALVASGGLMPGVLGLSGAPQRVSYFIAAGEASAGYQESDRELATWALRAWQDASGGRYLFEASDEASARILIRWASVSGAYGRTQAHASADGLPRATVVVTANIGAMGPGIARIVQSDPLMREVIVYLTCLHEIGHAIGLPHTDNFEDVMYDFANGGDIREYFMRYRRQITSRADIAGLAALSAGDREAGRK
jgi:hypothetical protein